MKKFLVFFLLSFPLFNCTTLEKFEGRPSLLELETAEAPREVKGGILFTYEAPQAREVYLAGSFNNWDPRANPLTKKTKDIWSIVIPLSPGSYEYKFVVDGSWFHDPHNPNSVPDPYGGKNSLLRVTTKGVIEKPITAPQLKGPQKVKEGILFTYYAPQANQVFLAGEFNSWSPNSDLMKKDEKGAWSIVIPLEPGTYQYKFVIDGTWKEDPQNPAKVDDGYGGFNSIFSLTPEGKIEMSLPKSEIRSEVPIIDSLASSGTPLYLALIWHQHQPRYLKDLSTGEYSLPWGRLHGIKDYYDMASILQEFPKIKYTINLTPSLLLQLEDIIRGYESGGATDKFLRLTLKPAEDLTGEDKEFLLRNFFSANWANMIDIHPRYFELRKKKLGDSPAQIAESINLFTTQDFRDLQVWFNLAWFDPDFQEGEVTLPSGEKVTVKPFIGKGKNFTEEDKKQIIAIQIKILKSIVPIHRRLQDEGRLEVITTPFYHPILPLLYDTNLAKVAIPWINLPSVRFSHPEDAKAQVELAVKKYESLFGQKPRGMWPGEGSVAEEIIPIVAEAGFKWMASDGKILGASLGKGILTPDEKYRPYIVENGGYRLTMIFRDTNLSDEIGFHYAKFSGVQAANQFIQKLYKIQREFANNPEPHIVPVILDGENAWEYYKHDGKDFFRSLYSQLSGANWVKTITVEEFLEMASPTKVIENLWAGSWINRDFSTWIGESEENLAWEYLAKTRSALEEAEKKGKVSSENLKKAYDEIYAAEGSDWFWWFGADQSAGMGDAEFDRIYRLTLKNVYQLIGETPPPWVSGLDK